VLRNGALVNRLAGKHFDSSTLVEKSALKELEASPSGYFCRVLMWVPVQKSAHKAHKVHKVRGCPVEMCELSELSELSLASAKGILPDQSDESTFVASDRCETRERCIGRSIKRIRSS
jgi:hypothetical protein